MRKNYESLLILVIVHFFVLTGYAGSGYRGFKEKSAVPETLSENQLKIEKGKDVMMLTYFRQRYPTRVEIDAEGKIVEVPLPDPLLVPKLHIALSTDGRHWIPLNDNKPVWNHFIRDPYVRRGPDGVWRILSTGTEKDYDRTKLGPGCLYVTSEDLIHWKQIETLPLMKDIVEESGAFRAQNIWAPEWFYDEEKDDYLLVWSSSFEDAGWKKSRLWYCRTKNWKTFTPAKVYFEPPYSVIDGTILKNGKTWYLFHKEEEFGAKTGERRAIRLATSPTPEGPWTIVNGPLNQGQIVPVITEGPTAIADPVKPGWLLYYDFCMADDFGVSWSPDLIHWTIEEDASFPPDARHGCVSLVSAEEAEALIKVYTSTASL